MVDTPLSGPSLVNDVSAVIPAIAKFVKSHVVISEDENPWIERDEIRLLINGSRR